MTRSPSLPLIVGLVVSLVTIAGMGWYTVLEVRTLRDEQTAISERNRRDSLQLIRIQSNLATLATALHDMADRVEPYPVVYWRQTFDRLRADLDEAIALENTFAPAERPEAQQRRLRESVDRLWTSLGQVFAQAAGGDEDGALARVRTSVGVQHQELVGLVSQFLVLNNRVQEEASQRNREVYERVVREIVVLVAALLVLVALTGAYTIWANRRAFQEVARLSEQLRTLSWRMLRIQEDLQQSFARELHDEFGQVFTAIGTLLGRTTRNLPAESPLGADVEEVRGIAQQTLERIRVQSRLLSLSLRGQPEPASARTRHGGGVPFHRSSRSLPSGLVCDDGRCPVSSAESRKTRLPCDQAWLVREPESLCHAGVCPGGSEQIQGSRRGEHLAQSGWREPRNLRPVPWRSGHVELDDGSHCQCRSGGCSNSDQHHVHAAEFAGVRPVRLPDG